MLNQTPSGGWNEGTFSDFILRVHDWYSKCDTECHQCWSHNIGGKRVKKEV